MDIGGWLRGLGLERYAEPFRANDIDLDVLGDLTDADLATLGVSLGDRKRLLRRSPAPRANIALPAQRQGAERRQLTVMFVDLVGSTALSTRLDPEELRDVIHAYQNTVAAEIARLEGHVAKFMGDGVLAYFGWPQAHEDEAERAVRAGLAVTAAVARLPRPTHGPAGGTGRDRDRSRRGRRPGRRRRGAGGGGRRRDAEPRRPPAGAGRSGDGRGRGRHPPPVGPAVRASPISGAQHRRGLRRPGRRVPGGCCRETAESRFEALHGQHLTPLVGREHELGLLLDRWRRARDGEGQVVLLVGEPGIGKSRLLQSLRERVAGEPHTRLRYFCSPFHQNTAFHPILDQIERAAGLRRDDPAERQARQARGAVRAERRRRCRRRRR